ncbi:transcription-repair coupling factor [Lachnoclostridium sp. MSJ-17]|uniref:transcription-repair coupling factor n=1 Tax=Lachnoclostridium sp. MSJ-17 TaxID=2841516 RepID=UPI0020A2160D|nr:transcription-repair coupling factor [Lachnoclostridium sp. MSJ-17]
MKMDFIAQALGGSSPFLTLRRNLKTGRSLCVSGLSAVCKADVIFTLIRKNGGQALCIASDEKEAQTLCNDLCGMGLRAFVYPVRDYNFLDLQSRSREYEHMRLKVLLKLIEEECDVVISCLDAASQLTVPQDFLADIVLSMWEGKTLDLDRAVRALTLLGYERFDAVEGSGQFSLRGGILDFFMPDADYPVRAEFWGDEITDLSYFDIETQRRFKKAGTIHLTPSTEIIIEDREELAEKIVHKAGLLRGKGVVKAREKLYAEAELIRSGATPANADKFIGQIYGKPECLFDYFSRDSLMFISEFSNVRDRGKSMDFQNAELLKEGLKEGFLARGFDRFQLTYNECMERFSSHGVILLESFVHGSIDLKLSEIITFTAKQLTQWTGSYKQLREDLNGLFTTGSRGVILAGTERAAKNLCDNLIADGYDAQYVASLEKASKGRLYVMPGALSAGFELPGEKFFVITFGYNSYRPEKKRKRRGKKEGQEIYSLSELTAGDYVVHSVHGIGIFSGIRKIDTHGIVKDYIKIDYAKGDALYVPVTQLDMVAKYIGPQENSRVKLNRLGSGDWQKAKARVKSSVKDIAKELIALYSARMKAKGYAFSGDNEWQRDFEAAFEYEETPDQLACIREIKHDMERTVPMDRLLCGDVGFGKTEVALRAAFKCVADSKQCALLCPTTILAWQHYQTVTKRFEGYPIRVELLSRFRTPKQQKEILERLRRGEVDMVVGTHRLVQKDVEFRDLGLAIIDEEQRFGVAQKERFKELVKNVDVLTLSATPIPRTLNMAMSGLRDMSVIEEAPMNRQPVQTYVLEHDNAVIYEAIRREMRRGGQVFYLHNNVETISSCASRIQEAIPDAKIAIGHGKMKENELSEVWRQMLEQEIDILVCTTIIETGVDLPNANTLIIENADCMGLSQLHQLRGRVGRSARRAYAYFTFRRSKVLTEIQQKRLAAIREYTEFGSGFKIAMRDLELRGAGNIMGAQQHGHMESVGYDMYLKLLGEAVSEERGETAQTKDLDCLIDISVDAHIPEYYVESLTLRLDVYRRIADIRTPADAGDVRDELRDRFGEIPKSVLGLIEIALIRNRANALGVYEIRQNEGNLLLYVREIKSPAVADLLISLNGKASLNAGQKPFLSVKCPKGEDSVAVLKRVFGIN